MDLELPDIRPEERTPLVEALLALIRQLVDRVGQLEATVQALRDEIARLQGQPPRPDLQPSRLEPKAPRPAGRPRSGAAKPPERAELRIDREERLHLDRPPPGASLRGYEPYVVQELLIRTETTRYLRARYELPGGGSVLAPLPAGVLPVGGGHFGANLVAYLLDQYHQAQVTEPLLLGQLWEYGIAISAGQLHRLLTEHQEHFHREKAELLAAGLTASSYIAADDTAARHRGRNGYCTVVGNDLFAAFESAPTKSRLNFLQVLHGERRAYTINDTALAYWQRHQLPAAVAAALAQGPREFDGPAAWQARLGELAITHEAHVRVASEGALLGGLVARGVAPTLGVLSDGAHQFVLFVHAACWVHVERPLAKLIPKNEDHRRAIEQLRGQVWALYQDLKRYRAQPDPAQRPPLEARFDALVRQPTAYPSLARVLKDMAGQKADLLRVLERPEIPLHNNAMESDIREFVKRRKVSGGTHSEAGRRCRDTFASLKKTCRKLGLRFWSFLQDRVRGRGQVPRLADLIRQKAQAATAPPVAAVPAPAVPTGTANA